MRYYFQDSTKLNDARNDSYDYSVKTVCMSGDQRLNEIKYKKQTTQEYRNKKLLLTSIYIVAKFLSK